MSILLTFASELLHDDYVYTYVTGFVEKAAVNQLVRLAMDLATLCVMWS